MLPTLNGSASIAGNALANGMAIPAHVVAAGSHTFRVDSTDTVGNKSSSSVTFSIVVAAQSLIDDVSPLQGNGLDQRSAAVCRLTRGADYPCRRFWNAQAETEASRPGSSARHFAPVARVASRGGTRLLPMVLADACVPQNKVGQWREMCGTAPSILPLEFIAGSAAPASFLPVPSAAAIRPAIRCLPLEVPFLPRLRAFRSALSSSRD